MNILKLLAALAVFSFWIWGCQDNNGWIAIGAPVAVIAGAIALGCDSGRDTPDPRGGPWEDGD
jgi:hypothetical protein